MVTGDKNLSYQQNWFAQPHAVRAVTASVYLIVQDCDVIEARAKLAGAEFLQELETKSYSGKSFILRDPEGQIWFLGEYDPWTRSTGI